MLKILVTNKFYEEDGKTLRGYGIKNVDTGEQMNVYKEALKQAAIKGEVEIVNMTLTSDGRLIGKAMKKLPEKNTRKNTGYSLECIYTTGRHISAALVDANNFWNLIGEEPKEVSGVKQGYTFDIGHETTDRISTHFYDNVKYIGNKADTTGIKRKSFSTIKDKLLKILKANNADIKLNVSKGVEKYCYNIEIVNQDEIMCESDVLVQIIYCLIEDAMYRNKITPSFRSGNIFIVKCMSGITDVRKAVRDISKPNNDSKKTNTKKEKTSIKEYSSTDIIKVMNKIEIGTPIKICINSRWKQVIYMETDGLSYTFFDNSGISGMFKFSKNFISDSANGIKIKLNDNDSEAVANLNKAIKEMNG